MSFCLITPRLYPAIDGIGDYCLQLMNNLETIQAARGGNHWQWTYLVHDGVDASRLLSPLVKIEGLETSAETLVSQLEALQVDTVLLQYVGYGYANNGAPLFLGNGLKQWRARNTNRRLIVMFHEVFSQGMPWQRVFWQVPEQKRSVSTLLDAASTVVTSMQPNANSIRSLRPHLPIKIIPIGSNFSIKSSADKNWKHLLIFGKQCARLRALKTHKQLLQKLAKEGLVEAIVLAGECTEPNSDQCQLLLKSWNLPVRVNSCYNFRADNFPDAIRNCGLSLMHTQSSNLLKSTSFQLAAQLGQVAITMKEKSCDPPFTANEHYLWYGANEETNIAEKIQDQMLLAKISESLSKTASNCLSWDRIADAWSEVLSPLGQ